MSQPQDAYLEAIRQGDRKGIEAIYEAFLPGIIRLVSQKGGTKEDALDIFQSALVVVYERARDEQFKLEGSFGGFLHAICRNLWGNRLQKKDFQEVRTADFTKYDKGDSNWDVLIDQEEKRHLLMTHLRRLGQDCQKVIRMFFERRSMKEIQEAMGWTSVSYASKRKFQCKERLINSIKADPRFAELNV